MSRERWTQMRQFVKASMKAGLVGGGGGGCSWWPLSRFWSAVVESMCMVGSWM